MLGIEVLPVNSWDGFLIFSIEMKGEVRAAKRASSGKIEREGLSDITNSPLAASKIPSEHPEPLLFPLEITEGYVDKLIQVRSYLCFLQFLAQSFRVVGKLKKKKSASI